MDMATLGHTSVTTKTTSAATHQDRLHVLSANIRGFRTNIGELTHAFVLKKNADIVVTVETFLDDSVESTFGKIPRYSHWHRRDRKGMQGGGIAVCYKEGLQIQPLNVQIPDWMESLFFRIILKDKSAILLCALYRPQWQGSSPINYLISNLDHFLAYYNCQSIMIVGDLNQHLIQGAFDELLAVQGLQNHVDFPTHVLGGSLDPVLSDLGEARVRCQPLSPVGSSDHIAVLSHVDLKAARNETFVKDIWLWEHANWQAIRFSLQNINWKDCLVGNACDQVSRITDCINSLQNEYVPHRTYKTKSDDQPWFGYRCKLASDAKYKAWRRYKQHPTYQNKLLHRTACSNMEATTKWAIRKWESDIKRKLRGNHIGSKQWWALVKEKQGMVREETIPPLNTGGDHPASSCLEKAEIFAHIFSSKMAVSEPNRVPPYLPQTTQNNLQNVVITSEQVKRELCNLNTSKAVGPDNISPRFLKNCAEALASPLAIVFNTCLREKKWPKQWKHARVTPVHKKKSKSDPDNYRPISLLSVLSKVLERIIASNIDDFFTQHSIISDKQFGFRKGMSTSDLLLLLSRSWNDALDQGKDTLVIALDIAGAFDRVWHEGLLKKLCSIGIQGDLLALLQDYLQDRTLSVAVSGQESGCYPVSASVPQGSVLGPILWNIFFNDLLQQVPSATAYADDCTISISYYRKDSNIVINEINKTLSEINAWGRKWQTIFAPEKTQAMVISRSPEASQVMEGKIYFGGKLLKIDACLSILGVNFDHKMNFQHHVKDIARAASLRVTMLRRMRHLLDERGLQTLYKAQVRPLLEYAPLTWMSCPKSYLSLLDKIQYRAEQLIHRASYPAEDQSKQEDSLQHRRDVATLAVMHKVTILCVPHLQGLRLPARLSRRSTRTALSSESLVEIPWSNSSQHQRTFIARAARLWNSFVSSVDVLHLNNQHAKVVAHRWRHQFAVT